MALLFAVTLQALTEYSVIWGAFWEFSFGEKLPVTRSLLDEIKTKQLQWYGHVQRMEEGRLPKEVMKWRPQ